ncbi:hypothetical protein [Actinomadura darangshiensis]|uniref:hypothetical protein n=1 Tax=Actinomadura darangshiensis TaxID=705336 RepID=UPI001A9DE6FF|nr:hypothetical protein [Actinomadura darangshiensis]
MLIEVDGRPATAEALAHPAIVNYGHFTAMQVRSGRVRGLAAHLRRLDEPPASCSGRPWTVPVSGRSSGTPPATRTRRSG